MEDHEVVALNINFFVFYYFFPPRIQLSLSRHKYVVALGAAVRLACVHFNVVEDMADDVLTGLVELDFSCG